MASVGLAAGQDATTASAPADSSRPGASSRPGQGRFLEVPYPLAAQSAQSASAPHPFDLT
jgi:hypothetical protein